MTDKYKADEQLLKLAFEVLENDEALTELAEKYRHQEFTFNTLSSTISKTKNGKITYGECFKENDRNKCFSNADFIIVIYAEGMKLPAENLKRLLLHELLHIGVEEKRKYIIPHDYADFKLLIDRYGTDWIGENIAE